MQVTLLFSYTEGVIPPRGHTPRPQRFDDGVMTVTVPSVSDAEAPVAIIASDFKTDYPDGEVRYRWYANKLWSPVHLVDAEPEMFNARTGQYGFPSLPHMLRLTGRGDEANAKLYAMTYSSRESQRIVVGALRRRMKDHLLVDGVPHRVVSEPRYVAKTYGLGGNNGGTFVFATDSLESDMDGGCAFSLMEKARALNHASSLAQERRDTYFLPMEVTGPRYQILIPGALRTQLRSGFPS